MRRIAHTLLELREPWQSRFFAFCACYLQAPWNAGLRPSVEEIVNWLRREQHARHMLGRMLDTWWAEGVPDADTQQA